MKISVIIAVYNNEDHIDQCIQSILSQNLTNFELIIINDGSTDSCGSICDNYAANDKRVKVYHQENRGVSAARNLGLENAKGEWITFVDSDDYVSGNYFDCVLEYGDQDFILVSLNRIENNEESEYVNFKPQKLKLEEFIRTYQLYPHFPHAGAKFYKAAIIVENKLKFDENVNFGEDATFNLSYLFNCHKIALTNLYTYKYRYSPEGLSNKKIIIVEDEQYFYEEIASILKSNLTDTEVISEQIVYPLKRYYLSVLRSKLSKKEKRTIIKLLIKKYKKLILKFVKGHRVHLIPLIWFIRFELVTLFVVLTDIRYKSEREE